MQKNRLFQQIGQYIVIVGQMVAFNEVQCQCPFIVFPASRIAHSSSPSVLSFFVCVCVRVCVCAYACTCLYALYVVVAWCYVFGGVASQWHWLKEIKPSTKHKTKGKQHTHIHTYTHTYIPTYIHTYIHTFRNSYCIDREIDEWIC